MDGTEAHRRIVRGVAHGWDRDRRRFPGTGSGSQDRPSGKRVRRTNRSRLLDGPRRPFGDHGLRRLVLHPLGVPLADDPNIYSVYWVQIAVEPQRGWCLANAHGFMCEPGSSVDAWVPKPPAYRWAQLDWALGHLPRPLARQGETAVSAEPRRHLSDRRGSVRWGSVFLALAGPQPR